MDENKNQEHEFDLDDILKEFGSEPEQEELPEEDYRFGEETPEVYRNFSNGYGKIQAYNTKDFKYYLNKKGKAVVCFEPYEIAYGGWFREFAINSKYK